ncbi:SAM-dependent methyltransferase [Erwinia psidii]|uniref:Class I SAM-dependent methyltransferase n=1 Tax=Erwinia psidii TaxID=69224 RepID=A0A3N6RYP2_9GAMM|nr:cyclopropane-fatty-acyl-phospholipid synthase family protein [Erwinia psidii]MCX8957299.1 class I SAM-dependent methyltransferase [Erwinia psidii]MCX8959669.1 class I SAM-dependent methyltransferase [Erwinia psidii]MCX8964612.1 class I SAM-dependent methyltransferase [Erwinia psidii]RQM38274.1 class I SAM-dependent methyltransferase [Erwinia psidii]
MYQPELTCTSRPRKGKRLSGSRRLIFSLLQHIQGAGLHLDDPHLGKRFFGDPLATLQAEVRVHHSRAYRRILTGGSIAAAETFMAGEWDTPDLTAVILTLANNGKVLDKLGSRFSIVPALLNKFRHLLHRNSVRQAQRNIAAHYDLGNDFYHTFLDGDMLYSSGWYSQQDMSLEQAQQAKMRRLCDSLMLSPEDHLLEIGTGWGAMAAFAAREYGCRVTTTTISQEQYDYSRRRIAMAGLSDRVTVLKQDYRQLSGQYDKLVSVEMIEAVGQHYIPLFFARCRQLLKPGGRLALQAITISESRFDRYARSVDFIQRYIFPGGFLPAVSMLKNNLAANRFMLNDLFEIGPHYARTLEAWRNRFEAAWPHLQNGRFDEHFRRMWLFYLCYCEAGFLARTIGTVQLIAEKTGD